MLIIGEKINATRRKIKKIVLEKNENKLIDLARKQVNSGANYVDVNVATGIGTVEDEIASMKWAVEIIQKEIDKPLCIDSADPEVIKAGLSAVDNKTPMINSTTAETESLDSFIPIAKEYNTPLVALAMDDSGIPKTYDARIEACKKIASFCEKYDFSLENILFDALVIPVSTDANQGIITLKTISAIKDYFPKSKTVLGLSNISYGLPGRMNINIAFLNMAVYAGLDAAICDPMNDDLKVGIASAEALLGKDRHFRRYMRLTRKLY